MPTFASSATPSFAKFGIEGHEQIIDIVRLFVQVPQAGLAASLMRTSEPPH